MIKKLLKKLTILTVIVVLLVTCFSVSALAVVTWHSEQADTGRQYPEGLGYDSDGNPGIAQIDYYSTPYRAIYRYKSSSGWVSEIIGEASDGPALAFSSSGQPSVLYLNYADNTYQLIYAKRIAANTWQKTTVDSVERGQGNIRSAYSLEFNAAGNPCVCYVKTMYSNYYDSLHYAAYNGSSWQKQEVYAVSDLFHCDLAFNGSTPAIAFSAGREGLKYAYLSGGNWTIQAADACGSSVYRNRYLFITLRFGNGKPLICYNDQDTRSLKFAYYLNGSWTAKTVEASASDKNYTGDYATMQVSQAAEGYVVYLAHSNYWLNGTTTVRLKTLAVNSDSDLTGTVFNSQTLHTGRFGNMTPLLACGLKDGNPSLAFLNFWFSTTTYISMQPKLEAVSSVSFGVASADSSASREITITNNGSLNLSVSEINAPSAPFRITGGDFSSLAPGESGVITVYFEPTAAGASYQDQLTIRSNDPDRPVFNIGLSGRTIGNNADLTELSFSNGADLTLLAADTEGDLTVAYASESLRITPTAAHAFAQIQVAGTTVASGQASPAVPLNIGLNALTIIVTSEDGTAERTYTLNITRRDSPDASLMELSVSDGTLSSVFSPEILSYTMTLPDGVSSFYFIPTATQAGSTISVNGTAVPNGSPTYLLTAAAGQNTYTIHVLAPDGEATMDYVITVFRLPELNGISLNHGVLDTAFDPYDLTYTAVVPNSAVIVAVTPTADAAYSLTVNGDTVISAAASVPIALETGENTITIEVISADAQTSRTYTLTVIRLPGLTALSVGDTSVIYSPNEFELSVDITQAEGPIIFSTPDGMSVAITDSASSDLAVSDDGISDLISFNEGANGPFTIELTSPDCTEPTVYTLTVTRRPLLTSVEIAEQAITLCPDEYFYVLTVANSCENAVIRAAVNTGTTVVPDGNFTYTPVAGQTNTWTVENLRLGANYVYLRLTSADGQASTEYTFVVRRPPELVGLSVSQGTLSPAFNAGSYDYTANVGREVTSIQLNAVIAADVMGLTLAINGAEAYSDCLTEPIALSYGSNIIPVVVIVDSFVSVTYNVNVIREEPAAVTISPTSAGFDKYTSAAGYRDIAVTVTASENPLLAIKNGGSLLVAETDYMVADNTYTIKKEYLATLARGLVNLTFDFSYGTDPLLAVTVTDSRPSGNQGGGSSVPPTYSADVTGGGSVPINVNTGSGTAALNLNSISDGITGGDNMLVDVLPIAGVNSYTANLSSSAISGSAQGSLTMNTGLGNVTIPGNMLSGSGLTGDAGVTIGEGDKDKLPVDLKSVIGDRPLIQLTLSIDGERTQWSNPDAPVTVSVSYIPTPEELKNPESLVIWYIDGSGNAACVTNGRYDPASGTVIFSTTHFSDYALVYAPVSFGDVGEGAWYYKAVNYIAAREITNGTGNGNFSPNERLTRGELLVMLMRAYGIEADGNITDNFADAGDTYYTGYLSVAKRLGLTDGVGDNLFAPQRQITRQEMFTLLYNILKAAKQLPQADLTKALLDFADVGQIEPWAKEAVTLLAATGIVEGSGGKLDPNGTATRAQMAQLLYKL